MDDRDIRAFLERDWARVAESKAEFWAARKRRLGPAEGVRISDALRRQVIAVRPDWPDEGERAADLEAHILLSGRMKNASARFGR